METYDEINKRMSSALGASAEIQSVAGTIGSRPKVPPIKPKKNIDSDFDDFSLSMSSGGSGGSGEIRPFQVQLVNPATPTAAINASSRLYKSISTTDTLSITDLTTAFTLATNTYVWIQVTVSSLAPTAASRQTGTAWPTLVVTSGSPAAQTQFNIPVGRVVASDPDKPGFEFSIAGVKYHFEQCLNGHLLIENRCNSGTPILYGFPWGGAA